MAETDTTLEEAAWEHPPAYIRVTVLVGVATLLLGLSGLFWLESGPPSPAFVRVKGIKEHLERMPGVSFEIQATWEDDAGELRGEVGSQGREPDVWLFYDAPIAAEVRLMVYLRNEVDRRIIAEGNLRLQRGKLLELGTPR